MIISQKKLDIKEVEVLEENNRQSEIHAKGFAMRTEYGSMKADKKLLEDISINVNALKTINKAYTNKIAILKALKDRDIF